MIPPFADVARAHRRLERLIADLTDEQVAAPTALPNWTRGHVLVHLADACRAFADITEAGLRGKLIDFYAPGQRDAVIDRDAALPAAEHRAAIAKQAARLETVWERIEPHEWATPVRFRNGDLTTTVLARWREVWIHMVDLDLGVTHAEWPVDFSCHAIDFLRSRIPSGVRLRASDQDRSWGVASDPVCVTGPVRELAAWAAQRCDGAALHVEGGSLPRIGPWPPHPAPTR